jgi:hypothetical protein
MTSHGKLNRGYGPALIHEPGSFGHSAKCESEARFGRIFGAIGFGSQIRFSSIKSNSMTIISLFSRLSSHLSRRAGGKNTRLNASAFRAAASLQHQRQLALASQEQHAAARQQAISFAKQRQQAARPLIIRTEQTTQPAWGRTIGQVNYMRANIFYLRAPTRYIRIGNWSCLDSAKELAETFYYSIKKLIKQSISKYVAETSAIQCEARPVRLLEQ